MDSPLYSGEPRTQSAGIPFPPLTPYADVSAQRSAACEASSPGRALFSDWSPGMQHSSSTSTPRRSQVSLRQQQPAKSAKFEDFRAILRSSSKTQELAAEDHRQARLLSGPADPARVCVTQILPVQVCITGQTNPAWPILPDNDPSAFQYSMISTILKDSFLSVC